MRNRVTNLVAMFVAMTGFAIGTAQAEANEPLSLVLKNQKFQPARITIPAGKQVKLMVSNQDSTPAEFESYDIGVEKVIPGQTNIPVYVGPLDPGTYRFFNDFDQQTTGTLIVE